MNFLAHLYLADPTPAAMLGSLLPDLHRGRLEPGALGPAVWDGVCLHRRTDAFTDTHPVFERSRARLRPSQGHFAGVAVDVIYDHCLSAQWSRYHDLPRAAFIQRAYSALRTSEAALSPRTQGVLDMLCREDWLTPYATVEGTRQTLARLSARVFERSGRRVTLEQAADRLAADYDAFIDDFDAFFPRLMDYLGVESRKAAC